MLVLRGFADVEGCLCTLVALSRSSSRAKRLTLYTQADWSVRRLPPMRPAIGVPGHTLPGSWHCPVEPRSRCALLVPWLAGPPAKPKRFMTPWKPFKARVSIAGRVKQ